MAANSSLVLVVNTTRKDPKSLVSPSNTSNAGLTQVVNFLEACTAGYENASVDVGYSTAAAVAASGTVTLATAVATNTVTIGGVVMTAVASGPSNSQFVVTGTNNTDAAALAAAINANTTLQLIVSAAAVGAVCTITVLEKGTLGNYVTLASSGATVAVSGAYLAGGTGGLTTGLVTYRVGL